jgi:hypothetical protein
MARVAFFAALAAPVAWAGVLHLAAWRIGQTLCRLLGVLDDEAFVHALVGFAALALGAFALGVTHLLYPRLLIGLVIPLAALGAGRLLASRPRLPRPTWEDAPLLAGIAFALLFLPAALHPILQHDDMSYHLALPRLYLHEHAIVPVPNLYGNMPHLIEVLYTLPMAIGDYVAPKVLTYTFVFWTIAGLYGFVHARWGRLAAGLAVLVLLSGKNLHWHLGLAYIEPILGAFLLLAVRALVAWRERRDEGALRLLGIACGVALASKYTAWLYSAPILLAASVDAIKMRRFAALRNALGLTALFALPWLVKNAILTGNPIYPNLYSVLGGRGWSALQQHHYMRSMRSLGGSGLKRVLRPPIILCTASFAYECPSFSFAAMVLFFGALIVPACRRGALGVLQLVSLAGFAAWTLTLQHGRYLVAWLPVMVLSGSAALGALAAHRRWLLATAVPLLGVAAWQFGHLGFPFQSRLDVFTTPRAQILEADEAYAVAEYVNRVAPPDGKVLGMFDNRLFFVERPVLADSFFQSPDSLARLRQLDDADAFARALRAEGFTHVIFGTRPANFYFHDDMPGWSLIDDQYPRARFQRDTDLTVAFISRHLEPLFARGALAVFRLRDTPSPATP